MARVFVSHAGRDRVIAGEVAGWLGDEGHELFYDEDLRAGLAVGEQWQDRLFERLRWADAVVCVITSAFVASAWCSAEVGVAISRGSRVVPVVVESGVRHPLLVGVQFADYAGDRTAARAVVAEALRRVDSSGGRGWVDGRSPFPGLRPFDTDMNRVFFGRRAEVGKLTELLRSPATRADRGVVVVTGPSGCGKSSLVRAGLVPAMAEEPGWGTLPVMLPGGDPVGVLAREFTGEARRLGLDWQLPVIRSRLDGRDVAGLVDELLLAAPATTQPRRRLLIVVDQFEELLTLTGSADRVAFAGILGDAMAGPATVVATLRPEFLTRMLDSTELGVLRPRSFLLRPLDRGMLPEVILGPADLAGVTMDPELVGRLVADTGTGEALPLLAFTLQQLATDVPRGGHLSTGLYERLGGVRGALTSQADDAMHAATAATGRTTEQVLAGLLRLVSVDEHRTRIRIRVPVDDLPEATRVELGEFTARRLLTTDTENNLPVIGVTHEAFLTAWPPLEQAITRHATALRARRAVEAGAAEWDAAGRHRDRLWERGRLAAALNDLADPKSVGDRQPTSPSQPSRAHERRRLIARRGFRGTSIDLSSRGRDFLATSIRTDRRRRARGTTILTLLLVASVTAAIVAVIQQRSAQQLQRVATARQLIEPAETIKISDPRTAVSLALAANALDPGRQTTAALFDELVGSPIDSSLTGHTGPVSSVAFSPGGRILATAGGDRTVILWDVTDPNRATRIGEPLTGHTDAVTTVAFAPDGRTLATGSSDRTVILWNVTDPARPARIGGSLATAGVVSSVAFSPDGHTLATGSGDQVLLWDIAGSDSAAPIGGPLTGHTAPVTSVAFAPDGRTLATGSDDRAVILWDVTDPTRAARIGQPITAHTDAVRSVAFSPDGHTLATGSSDDRAVILWDVTDPTRPTSVGQPLAARGEVSSLAFSPDGRTVATGGNARQVILWDLTDPIRATPSGTPLTGHTDTVRSVAFAPDGHTLATGSDDGTVLLWDLTRPAPPTRIGAPLPGNTDAVSTVTFSPDGHTLATASRALGVTLWNLTDPSGPADINQPPTDPSGNVISMAVSRDWRTLATTDGGTVILWDLSDPKRPAPVGEPLTDPPLFPRLLVAFSQDGRMLAVGNSQGGDGPLRIPSRVNLWDVREPARPIPLGRLTAGNRDLLHSIAFAPDGRTLATGSSDRTVNLLDITDPNRPTPIGEPLTGHTDGVTTVAFAPDGRTLATGSDDRTVILWDVTDPNRATRIGEPLTGHTDGVTTVAFAPDGRTLATGSDDRTVILWDVTDPNRATRIGEPLTGHTDGVTTVAFAPDGRTLATGSDDGTVILQDIARIADLRGRLQERACAVTGGGLTADQWSRYIPDLPYREACTS